VVVERMMSPGEVVDDETLLRVAQIDPLWVEALLPAADFGSVRPGMRAAVTPELPGDEVHVAEVVVVDRVIDPASGTFAVRLALPNPDHAIPSGLHCRVRFLAD
jgi:multidrug efflux pump subunit AcrA (membrane-fusion protein)